MALLAVLLACPVAAIAVEGDTDTQPGTVQGFTPGGTTINLFDYWITGRGDNDVVSWDPGHAHRGINKGHTLYFGKGMSGGADDANEWTESAKPRTRLVANKLNEDGYPVLAVGNNESLAYLFNLDSFDGKQAYSNVGNLLQVDDTGYFYYDCKENFAEFSADDNAFKLYGAGAVKSGGSSPDGQFFPFNTYNQVAGENIDSVNEVIKHYFGMTMRTRFVQQNGGYTTPDKDQAVTYNFSGDDDIWIFIDGVLVGDLGGIHNATSIEIDFSTGMVYVYDDNSGTDENSKLNNEWDKGETVYNGGDQGETLRSIFERVLGEGNISDGLFSGNTFADDTYHTLDFFFLERGNTDSNMALKYNLINIPETDIVKVDQDGEPVVGAEFKLYDRAAYAQDDEPAPLASAVTEADGSVVLLDPNNTNRPITLESLWGRVMEEESAATTCDLMMVETGVPAGHRASREIPLQILKENDASDDPFYLLLSEDPWTTGAYAMPKVMLTAPSETSIEIEPIPGSNATWDETLKASDIQDGLLFAIVEKKVGTTWLPVHGDPLTGWTVADELKAETVIDAAKATHAQFAIDTTGSFRAEVNSLPGDILSYSFFAGEDMAEYRGAYFYSKAKTFDDITKDNTATVTNPEAFTRNFSARVYVSNIINRFAVQKLDDEGNPVNGATMALYTNDQVTVDKNGVATPNENANPQTAKTKKLTKENAAIDLEGACIFTNLDPGVYWVGEQTSPKDPSVIDPNGYLKNNTLTKVLVTDDGVFADAGKAGDGVTVMRGVGRLMRSMVQFAVEGDIDVTLHNIVAQACKGKMATTGEGASAVTTITWEDPIDESAIHLQYAGTGSENGVLDYKTDEKLPADELQNVSEYYTVDEGVPGLVVNQCAEHKVEGEAAWTPLVEDDNTPIDITPLFTGVNVVRIANQRVSGLDVTKRVEGSTTVDSDAEFTFTVRFMNPVGEDGPATPLTQEQAAAVGMSLVTKDATETFGQGEQSIEIADDGSVKVTITADETARFLNVPVDMTYTVTEEPLDGYVLSDQSTGMTGTIAFSDQRAVATAAVKNIKVDGATAAIDVQKTVAGTETADNFTFTIALSSETDEGIRDGVSVMRDGQLKQVGTEGIDINPVNVTADFTDGHMTNRASSEQLVFTEEGEYVFDVKETVTDEKPNWTYDSTFARKVTVVVKQDKQESDTDTRLTAEVFYDNSGAPQENDKQVGDAAAFTNVYTAPTTTVQIKAIKRLTGDPTTLRAGQFTFELCDEDGETVATAKNDASGNVIFNAITYDTAGTYTYTLREVLPDDDDATTPGIQQDGFTYDGTVYDVTVTVAANGQGGLTAAVAYSESVDGAGVAVDTPVFENAYTKQGGDPVIPDEPDPDTPDPDTPDPDDPDPDTPDPDTPDTPDTPEPETPDTPDNPDDTPGDKIPGTGDTAPIVVAGVAALGVACIAGAVLLKRRGE